MGRKTRETTISERKIILKLSEEGNSYSTIARIVNRSRFTVRNIIKRFSDEKNVENLPRSGRPQKLTDRDKRKVTKIVKKYPKVTSTEIAAQMKSENKVEVHPITIRRVLKSAGYNSRVARRKPLISKINQKNRLEFAEMYVHKNLEFWDRILFSDESKFNIFKSDGQIRIWRKRNTELDSNNIVSTVKHGGGNILVWGCMSSSGLGELVFIDGIMDKFVYLNILKQNLKKSVEKLNLGENYYFQQDHDPKHTAYIVRQWIIFNTPHTLPTPPQSPDLNPIEHIWNELETRIRKHPIQTKEQLKDALVKEWNEIGLEVTQNLVHSMPNRLQSVIKRKGLQTKY